MSHNWRMDFCSPSSFHFLCVTADRKKKRAAIAKEPRELRGNCNQIILISNVIRIPSYLVFYFQIEAPVYANLVSSFEYLEISNRKILNYGWVNFPLAYTQIANFSVYMYVFVSLFACQFLHPPECEVDDIECLNDSHFKDTGIHFSSKPPFGPILRKSES